MPLPPLHSTLGNNIPVSGGPFRGWPWSKEIYFAPLDHRKERTLEKSLTGRLFKLYFIIFYDDPKF